RPCAATRIPPVIVLERRLEHAASFGGEHSTRSLIRDRQPKLQRRARRTCPVERRADVVQLGLDPSDVGRHTFPLEELDAQRVAEEELGVATVQLVRLAARLELLARILAKRLQQDEAKLVAALLRLQQAALHEPGEPVDDVEPEI